MYNSIHNLLTLGDTSSITLPARWPRCFSLNEVKSPESLSKDHLKGIVLTCHFHFWLALQGKFLLLSNSLQIMLSYASLSHRSPTGSDEIKQLFFNYFHLNLTYERSACFTTPPWALPPSPETRMYPVSFIVLFQRSFNLSLFGLLNPTMNYSPRNLKIEFHYLLIMSNFFLNDKSG